MAGEAAVMVVVGVGGGLVVVELAVGLELDLPVAVGVPEPTGDVGVFVVADDLVAIEVDLDAEGAVVVGALGRLTAAELAEGLVEVVSEFGGLVGVAQETGEFADHRVADLVDPSKPVFGRHRFEVGEIEGHGDAWGVWEGLCVRGVSCASTPSASTLISSAASQRA